MNPTMMNNIFAPGTLFSRIFHSSPVAMTIMTLDDNCYVDVNCAYAELVGRPREDLIGHTILEFPIYASSANQGEDDLYFITKLLGENERYLRTTKGDLRHVITQSQVEVWEGKSYLITLVQDLTSFDHTAEAVRASKARFRHFFESVPLPVFVYDLETLHILDFNSAAVANYGFSREELGSMTMVDIRPENERSTFLAFIPTMPFETQTLGIWKHQKKNGETMDVEITGYGLELDGRPARLAVCRDVTENLALLKALQVSEERYRIIADVTNDVLWDVHMASGRVEFSEGLLSVFGHKPTLGTTLDWWIAHIHHEDREGVSKGFYDALDGSGSTWSAQYRFRRGDGHYAHVLDRGYIFRHKDGRASRMIGAMIDITAQVEAKETATHAALEERRRLARDLHDSVTQSLYSLSLLSAAAHRHAKLDEWGAANEYIVRLGELAQQSLKEMRLLIYEMKPMLLESNGLEGALQSRLDAVERHSGVRARLKVNLAQKLSPQAQKQYYYVAIEALNNTLKHSSATFVSIDIQSIDGWIQMEICDNGRGFDPDAMAKSGGLGLTSMRERLEKLGGEFELESSPGSGTKIRVKIKHQGDNYEQYYSNFDM